MSDSSRGLAYLSMGFVLGGLLWGGVWALTAERHADAGEAVAEETADVTATRDQAAPSGDTRQTGPEATVDVAPRTRRVAEAEPRRETSAKEGTETAGSTAPPAVASPAPEPVPEAEVGATVPSEATVPPETSPRHAPSTPGVLESVAAPPAPAPVDRVLLQAGDRIRVLLDERLDSATSRAGQSFEMVVDEPLYLGEGHALEAGTRLRGTVVEAERARRPQKPGRLLLTADDLHVAGRWHRLDALLTAEGEGIRGRGSHEEDARDIGIGAAAGTVLGAILGGEKGALAGLVLGGGGVFLATRGEEVELPAGTSLIAEVQSDVWLALPRR